MGQAGWDSGEGEEAQGNGREQRQQHPDEIFPLGETAVFIII
ncbi:MAG: hypothetical protein M5U34_03100 [Chloroflexi bacterium]|nr:hypothetical protein [Chloroflexota bacterium]